MILLGPEVFTPPGSKHKKLVPHLGVRRSYIVSADNHLYYVSKGVSLEKIHKVLQNLVILNLLTINLDIIGFKENITGYKMKFCILNAKISFSMS